MAEQSSNLVQSYRRRLLSLQRESGGWGYNARGQDSWTEPTVLALLALRGTEFDSYVASTIEWLAGSQNEDGGWSPSASVKESTWVTALAVLALSGEEGHRSRVRQGVDGMLGLTGELSKWYSHLVRTVFNTPSPYSFDHHGWPWFPGSTAWVTPTSLGLLALEKSADSRSKVRERIVEAREMLLDRRCPDGGWNYGAPKALGFSADSYPETTGTALLALTSSDPALLQTSIERASSFLASAKYAEGVSWLQLGLLAHGEEVPAVDESALQCHGTLPLALRLLALKAQSGRNEFLS
jgi:hypothetical protein